MSTTDSVQRFIFENTDIRGERVCLQASFEDALAAHDYPLPVKRLLGELVAASVLLSTTLKFSGLMSLQVKGTGPLSLLMVECTERKSFRALARFSGDCEEGGIEKLIGQGQLVITIDPDKGQRYQGIVPLTYPTLSECLEHYFAQSEQLSTRIWLASDGYKAAGMLLQALPASKESSKKLREETWSRLCLLTNTVSDNELLSLESESLLSRLYHEEQVRLFDSEPVVFQCNCSRKRSAQIIHSIGKDEADSVIREQGQIAMDCQFCNQQYVFSPDDVIDIFNGHEGYLH
ncbi:Hsp33 family molecular chaperone HslO [Endozoicomonas sp. Mp262]|uniref:Hsp33 family molecular chaperone HslO n=1 Tax=Endozoicomonas sp. Mp262 TaxID=2919499 RepID=UPI0021DAEDCB